MARTKKQTTRQPSTLFSANFGAQKKKRFRPGAVALRQIREYERDYKFTIRRLPFLRLVRQIVTEIVPGIRCQTTALLALQELAEAFLVAHFEEANFCAVLDKSKTVTPKHTSLALRIRSGNHQF